MLVRAIASMVVLGALLGAAPAMAETTAVGREHGKALPSPSLPDATLTRTDHAGLTVVRIDGIITRTVEERFADTFRTLPRDRSVLVELSSPGGYTSAGYRMIDLIQGERQAGRAVSTRVRGGESCESMCVGVFLAGFPRYAAPSAEFMVHAPRMAEDGRMTLRSTQTMVRRLVSLGASEVWIERVKAAGGFSGSVDYRETAESLAAVGANIVTDLIR